MRLICLPYAESILCLVRLSLVLAGRYSHMCSVGFRQKGIAERVAMPRTDLPRRSEHRLRSLTLGLFRGGVAEDGVKPLAIVVAFDVGEQVSLGGFVDFFNNLDQHPIAFCLRKPVQGRLRIAWPLQGQRMKEGLPPDTAMTLCQGLFTMR